MSKKNKLIFYEDLVAIKDDNKELISTIQTDEAGERIETKEAIENDIKAVKKDVEMKKSNYIIELKTGLGEKVKKNPRTIKQLNNEWYKRLGRFIKGIFTKF